MTKQVEIAIIILNYRTAEMTLDCLASLEGEVTDQIRVIVVDNASGDGSANRIEQEIRVKSWAWAEVLRSPENGGFAAGNNLGILAIDAKAYVLLNSDTQVLPGAIEGLRRAMHERPDAGLIGPGILDGEGRPDQSFFRDTSPPSELIRSARTGLVTRALSRYDLILERTGWPMEPDWLGFACVLVRREVIERIGLLDDGFFMYFEDIDYCRRARAAGFKVLYWPEPKVVHLMGASSKVTARGELRRRGPRYYYEARSRYFAKFYGRRGLWLANGFYYLGRCVSLPRELVGNVEPEGREREALDLWINALDPLKESSVRRMNRSSKGANGSSTADPKGHDTPSHAAPNPRGDTNQNPDDIGLLALIAEDFETHDKSFGEPGFWAVAVHRFGNARMSVKPKALRAPLSAAYKTMFLGVNWVFGIDLSYVVKLGRRVRIWHHGGMVLGARAIGDDVHIRHNTTLGLARRNEDVGQKPIIGNRVDIGAGACILGAVSIGDDCVIGANSVVLRDLPPGSTVFGVPARPVNLKPADVPRPATREEA